MTRETAKKLWEVKDRNKVLIAAHRGTCGGNIIQNTTMAYLSSMQHGADMVEIDAIMTTDNKFYAFHDGQEKIVLGVDKDIKQMSSEEIDSYDCFNQLGEKSGYKLERLEYVLENLRGKCLINIDRSWFYWKETIEFLEKMDMNDQILLKSPVSKELLDVLADSKSQIMYMPIVKSVEDWNTVMSYPTINTVAAELIFDNLNSDLIKKEFIEQLHKKEILTWVNAITLNDSIVLSAKLDDDNAIKCGYDANWGKLIEMGFDIIQTDWPGLIKQYILNR